MPNCFRLFAAIALSSWCVSSVQADQYIHHWVGPKEDGTVTGRIVVPGSYGSATAVQFAEVTIRPLGSKQIQAQSMTDATGRFTFDNVDLGAYVVVSQTDRTFACSVLHVVDSTIAGEYTDVEIPAAMLDRVTVRTAITRYLSTRWNDDIRYDLPDESTVFNGTPLRVALTEGGVNGRMMRDPWVGAEETNVFLFRDGVEVARTITDSTGWFRLENMEPGKYSVLGVGRHGICAHGVQLFDASALASLLPVSQEERTLIAQAQDSPPAFALQLAPPTAFEEIEAEEEEREPTIVQNEREFLEALDGCACDPLQEVASVVTGPIVPTGSGGFYGASGGFGVFGAVGGAGRVGGSSRAGGRGRMVGLLPIGAIAGLLDSDDDGAVPPDEPSPIVP